MGLQRKANPLWPFFLFHLRVGARVALRKVAAIVAVIMAVYMILWPHFFHLLLSLELSGLYQYKLYKRKEKGRVGNWCSL